jgi:hypothetical protein
VKTMEGRARISVLDDRNHAGVLHSMHDIIGS